MIVYIEDTIIENFLVTYLIEQIVFSFIKHKKSNIRIWLSCAFASIIAIVYPLLQLNNLLMMILKFLIGFIICLIAYKGKNIKSQMLYFVMFMFVTSIYGGMNLFIYFAIYGNFESSHKLPTVFIVFSLLAITYLLKQCQKALYEKKKIHNFIYQIEILNNGEVIKTNAYLDSGNILQDDKTQKPVILVNYKIFEKINKNYSVQNLLMKKFEGLKNGHFIMVKTATSNSQFLAFSVDELKVFFNSQIKVYKNPTFALSKVKITGFDCDVILNSKLIGE